MINKPELKDKAWYFIKISDHFHAVVIGQWSEYLQEFAVLNGYVSLKRAVSWVEIEPDVLFDELYLKWQKENDLDYQHYRQLFDSEHYDEARLVLEKLEKRYGANDVDIFRSGHLLHFFMMPLKDE